MATVKIEELINSPNPDERSRAVSLLARSGLAKAIPYLERFASSDPDAQIRALAGTLLSQLRSTPSDTPSSTDDAAAASAPGAPSSPDPAPSLDPSVEALAERRVSRPSVPVALDVPGTAATNPVAPAPAEGPQGEQAAAVTVSGRVRTASGTRRATSAALRSASMRTMAARQEEPKLSWRSPRALGLGALATTVLFWLAFRAPPRPPPPTPAGPAVVSRRFGDADAARRYRGRVKGTSEDGRRLLLETADGPVEALFTAPIATELAAGSLVEVEGKPDGADPSPSSAKTLPRRLHATLIKTLAAR